jgi:asparagine synthase (glutamine-hydrolysing)
VPLLDTPLVEFVSSLPDAARQRPGVQKALLASAIEGALPKQVFEQPKKTFTLPWKEWLRGPLRARIERSLSDLSPALGSHVHANGAKSVWQDFLAGKTSWSRPWSIYVLNEWCRLNLS